MKNRFEILLRGFNAASSATDHLVIWIATDLTADELSDLFRAEALMGDDGFGPIVALDKLPSDDPFDFALPADVGALLVRVTSLLDESSVIFEKGCHYAAGVGAFRDGIPRALPSYFTKPKCANAKAWFAGWDHDRTRQRPMRFGSAALAATQLPNVLSPDELTS